MARIVTLSVITSLLIGAVGCGTADTSRASRLPNRSLYESSAPMTAGAASGIADANDETAIVEQLVKNRQDYQRTLNLLIRHYTSSGDNERLKWAQDELRSFQRMTMYDYIIDPSILSETLRGTQRNPEADAMFQDALKTQRQAQPFGSRILPDEGMLRVALRKYFQLIRQYPNSDRISHAAWQSAGIYEYFKDYSKAITFYKRTFQWDPSTTYPARFKAAELLDKMGRRDEALPLYQEAVSKETRHPENMGIAQRRIKELTTSPNPRP